MTEPHASTPETGPRFLMVTGCYRSGTTLAEKLLHSHPRIIVGSQPFPVLYFDAKQAFLDRFGLDSRYPLNHLFGEIRYTPKELRDFLDSNIFDAAFLERLFNNLKHYTAGLWTPEILSYRDRTAPGRFLEIFQQLTGFIGELFPKPEPAYLGVKEILTEEMAEYLGGHGVRLVFVVRDPRDMIASLNFRDRDNLTGENRPVLYSLRAWRKSVALGLHAEALGHGVMIRYEDLARHPMETLKRLMNSLLLPPLEENAFQNGILDQWGRNWGGNSSFEVKRGISTGSIGTFRKKLPPSVTRFVETCCLPEMSLLGYEPELIDGFDVSVLEGYHDPFPSVHFKFPPDYSSDPSRLSREIERFKLLERGKDALGERELQGWFLRPVAYERLRGAVYRDIPAASKRPGPK